MSSSSFMDCMIFVFGYEALLSTPATVTVAFSPNL